MNTQKEELKPEYHQYYYGPFSGVLGQTVVAALYLDARWDHFIGWLESCGIDPACCQVWVEEKLTLLKMMQSVKRLNTGVSDFSDYGSKDRDWVWVNEHMDSLIESDQTLLAKVSVRAQNVSCLDPEIIKHSQYSSEASELLAGLFLKNNELDFRSWLTANDMTEANAHVYMKWYEKKVSIFRQFIGPDIKNIKKSLDIAPAKEGDR